MWKEAALDPMAAYPVMAPEVPGARLAGLGAEHARVLLTDFEQIYQSGAVKPPRISDGVLKVAEMLNISHLGWMPVESKRAALWMALYAGGAKIEDILQDAIVRQRSLNDYEDARQGDLQNFEAAILEQSRAIQAEMAHHQPIRGADAKQLDAVARAQDNFRVWQKRKLQEAQRIADAAGCCVPKADTPAAAGLTVVPERASSAAAR